MQKRALGAMAWFEAGLALARAGVKAARQPTTHPPPRLRDVLKAAGERAFSARLLPLSAEVAFFALLSLVPALSILVLVYGLVSDRTDLWSRLAPFVTLLPDAAQGILQEQTMRLAQTARQNLSLEVLMSVLIAAWSANAATKALFEAVNLLHGRAETRGFMRLNLLSLGVTLGGVLFIVAALTLLAILPLLQTLMPDILQLEWALSFLRFPLLALTSVAFVTVLYRFALIVPPPLRELVPGALLAVALWIALSLGFGWYAARLGHYAATYGSLAAVIVFMTWLWLTIGALLAGAALNAARVQFRKKDAENSAKIFA